jgi:hypothetical protein
MHAMAKTAPTIPLLENHQAPEIFASSATGFSVSNGTITVTLESLHADHTESGQGVSRVVVGRIVMPVAGAQGLAVGLFDFLEKQGFRFQKPA